MKLEVLQSLYAVCKIPSARQIPDWAFEQSDQHTSQTKHIVSLSVTDKEGSLVLPQDRIPADVADFECEKNWRAFRVAGTLDFNLVGVIAAISSVLRKSSIPIFVVSTFETDYILISVNKFEMAKSVLESANYTFE